MRLICTYILVLDTIFFHSFSVLSIGLGVFQGDYNKLCYLSLYFWYSGSSLKGFYTLKKSFYVKWIGGVKDSSRNYWCNQRQIVVPWNSAKEKHGGHEIKLGIRTVTLSFKLQVGPGNIIETDPQVWVKCHMAVLSWQSPVTGDRFGFRGSVQIKFWELLGFKFYWERQTLLVHFLLSVKYSFSPTWKAQMTSLILFSSSVLWIIYLFRTFWIFFLLFKNYLWLL